MRALLVAIVALPLAMLSLASQDGAQASPTQVAQLERELGKLNQQSDQLVEQYLQAKLTLDRTNRTLGALRLDADNAEQTLRAAQQRLGARAAAAYIEGPGNNLAAVLGATDPGDTIDRVQLLELLARQDGDLLSTLDIAGKTYAERKGALEATQRQQAKDLKALEDKKDKAQEAADRTEALLSQVKAADRARVLAAADQSASSGSSGSSSQPVSFPNVPASGAAAKAVAFAKAQVGKPYQFGADGPGSYDCSGLTMQAWAAAGVGLPHSAAMQYDVTRHISSSELQPGDLIFRYSPISHVAMYIGGGQQIAATHTGDYVRVQSASLSGIVGYGRPAG
jgi:peptidoglycan DL-endopeptidase CwlO